MHQIVVWKKKLSELCILLCILNEENINLFLYTLTKKRWCRMYVIYNRYWKRCCFVYNFVNADFANEFFNQSACLIMSMHFRYLLCFKKEIICTYVWYSTKRTTSRKKWRSPNKLACMNFYYNISLVFSTWRHHHPHTFLCWLELCIFFDVVANSGCFVTEFSRE